MTPMKKSLIVSSLMLLAIMVWQLAGADPVGPSSGVNREVQLNRWSTAKVGSEIGGTTATTNVVQTVGGSLGKVVWLPAVATDKLQIYNASAGSGATAANLIFETGTTNLTVGVPTVYDLSPGFSATTGITTITTRAITNSAAKAYIQYVPNAAQ